MKILLDTHIFLWFISGDSRLSTDGGVLDLGIAYNSIVAYSIRFCISYSVSDDGLALSSMSSLSQHKCC